MVSGSLATNSTAKPSRTRIFFSESAGESGGTMAGAMAAAAGGVCAEAW